MLSNISWVKISEMLNIDENCFRWQITRCWRSRMLWWRTNWRPSERVYRHDIIETCTSMIIGKVYLFWWDHQECVWMCHFEKCTYMNIEKDTIKVIGVFDACFFFLQEALWGHADQWKRKRKYVLPLFYLVFQKNFTTLFKNLWYWRAKFKEIKATKKNVWGKFFTLVRR